MVVYPEPPPPPESTPAAVPSSPTPAAGAQPQPNAKQTPPATQACGAVGVDLARVDRSAAGRVVVLGSSTAEGQKAKNPDNAWVSRYRAYLKQEFPNFTVENLAKGGFTSYRIQPTGYEPPENRPGPDKARNITAALALDPTVIIINLPSNDQEHGFTTAEEMDNFERVAKLAEEHHVALWVTTTQPRKFDDAERGQALIQTRDAIRQRFGAHAIDFWTSIVNSESLLRSEFDSGDGVHLNDLGHGALARLVISCAIPEVVLSGAQPAR